MKRVVAAALCAAGICCAAPAREGRGEGSQRSVAVLIGSSTALGVGASSTASSWAGLLGAWLQQRGITLINSSVSSTRTIDSIARFDRAVTPFSPAFVILATSIWNEDLAAAADPAAVAAVYLQNTRRLIGMVEALGAIPILITPFPGSGSNPALRAILLDMRRQFQAEGVTAWDFFNAVEDGYGRWLPGLTADGVHPNDAGHLRLFASIPLTFFEAAFARRLPPLGRFGAWRLQDNAGPAVVSVDLDSPTLSWTIAFSVDSAGQSREQLLVTDGPAISVWRSGAALSVSVAGRVVAVSPALPSDAAFAQVCLSYRETTGNLTLYVNGVEAGAATARSSRSVKTLQFGAAQPGSSLSRIFVYRTPLTPEEVVNLSGGRTPVLSLAAELPLAQSPGRKNLNLATTDVGVAVSGPWTWSPDGPGPVSFQ